MNPFSRSLMISALWIFACAPALADGGMGNRLLVLQHAWAKATYQVPKGKQEHAFDELAKQADGLVKAFPGRAEPLVWDAIVLSTEAGVRGGLSALSLAKQARDRLQQAEKINPQALHGSVYTSLGALYYKVPGWPLGFGDDDKAEACLKKALAINPTGIDPNYFYADFLYENGHYARAATYAQRALKAPARPDRPLADAGRRAQVKALMAKIQGKLAQADAGKHSGGALWN